MNISDNILEHHLSHVYWVAGTCCGGKTTMTTCLAEKHGMTAYYSDDRFQEHKAIGSMAEQPAMLRHFLGYEWFFNRPVEEYARWLTDSMAEEMDMIVVDLLQLPKDKPIVVDVHCFPDLLRRIAKPNRIAFLLAEPQRCRSEYFNRLDKQDMYRCIMGLNDPQKSLANVMDTVENTARADSQSAQNSGMKCFVRDDKTTVEQRLWLVEEHFGLAH